MPLQVKRVQLKLKDENIYKDGDLLFNVDAQAWAKGTRNGTTVPAPVTPDNNYPHAENNAEYYSEQSARSAEAAADAALTGNLADIFDNATNYEKGEYVIFGGDPYIAENRTLYRFIANHPAGNWIGTDVQQCSVADEFEDMIDDINNLRSVTNVSFSKDPEGSEDSKMINASINGETGKVQSNSKCRSIYLPCMPNSWYVVSKIAGTRFAVGDTVIPPTAGVICNNVVSDWTAEMIKYKTSANANYLICYVGYFDERNGGNVDYNIGETAMLNSVNIEFISADDSIAKNNMISDVFRPRLVECIRNVGFINTEGERILNSLTLALGFDGWVDIAGSYSVSNNPEKNPGIIITAGDQYATSKMIDVGNAVKIRSKFIDNLQPKLYYAIACYNGSQEYINRATPDGASEGPTLKTLQEGTRYIRFIFKVGQDYHNIVSNYTGRGIILWMFDSNDEVIQKKYVLTKTEDISNVM